MAFAPAFHRLAVLVNIVGVLLWRSGGPSRRSSPGDSGFHDRPVDRFFDPTAQLYSLQASFGVAAFWIVFSTIASPLVIQKVIATGELAGGQLIAGAFSSFFQTAATTAGAAAVAAPIGVPAVTAGATGMAAILSTLSSAAGHGSAGAIIIAGSGLPPRSARGRPGDDITGDKAVRELIARTKGHYY